MCLLFQNVDCLVCNSSDSSLLGMITVRLLCLLLQQSSFMGDHVDVDGQFYCHLIHLWLISLGIWRSYIKCIHHYDYESSSVVYVCVYMNLTSLTSTKIHTFFQTCLVNYKHSNGFINVCGLSMYHRWLEYFKSHHNQQPTLHQNNFICFFFCSSSTRFEIVRFG